MGDKRKRGVRDFEEGNMGGYLRKAQVKATCRCRGQFDKVDTFCQVDMHNQKPAIPISDYWYLRKEFRIKQQQQHLAMLPVIKRSSDLKFYEFRASEDMPSVQISHSDSQLPPKASETRYFATSKVTATHKSNTFHDDQPRLLKETMTSTNPLRYSNFAPMYRSSLSDQIKIIEKRIRRCERKIRQDKIRELEDKETASSRKEYQMIDMNRFDFLTNPGGRPGDEVYEPEQPEQQEEAVHVARYQPLDLISESVQKLGIHYAKDLRRKFQRRQLMPHKPCRRKVPRLYITQHSNSLKKTGKPLSQQQHLFRVLTREITPQEIYPAIPNFPVVRDTLSKNVLAYLGDYKPFIERTKEALPIFNKMQQQSGEMGDIQENQDEFQK